MPALRPAPPRSRTSVRSLGVLGRALAWTRLSGRAAQCGRPMPALRPAPPRSRTGVRSLGVLGRAYEPLVRMPRVRTLSSGVPPRSTEISTGS